jgi:N-methylhydantoinase A
MPIDPERSVAAISRIADRLGLGLYETAAGISRIVDAKMADLIRRMSVMRGFDPRQFCCFAFGGGGPVHAAAVAREAGVARVIVPLPVTAALWSAVGAATADVVHVLQSPQTFEEPFRVEDLLAEFQQLEARALQQLGSEGFASDRITLTRRIRMKYAMQVHDVEVPVDTCALAQSDAHELIHRFGEIYENLFGAGSGFREGGVEITGFQVRACGETEKMEFAAMEDPRVLDSAQTERDIYWGETGQHVATPIWEIGYGDRIPPMAGPALVQLPDSVVVIRPAQTAEMDELGNIIIRIL